MWRCTGPLAVIGQLFEAIIENGKIYDYRLLYERGVSVTKDDFVRALAAEGITMDDHRMSYHIRMAELSGTLCSGNLHPQKATYDEFLIGYKSRDVVLDPDFSHRAHNRSGIFYPVILKDGRVCGNWRPSDMSLLFFDGEEVDDSVAAKAISSYSCFAEGKQINRKQQ